MSLWGKREILDHLSVCKTILIMLIESNILSKRLRSSVDEDESKFRYTESVVERDNKGAKFQLVYLLK